MVQPVSTGSRSNQLNALLGTGTSAGSQSNDPVWFKHPWIRGMRMTVSLNFGTSTLEQKLTYLATN